MKDIKEDLALLGRHVAFLGEKVNKAVTDKYLPNLDANSDGKKFSLKLAQVLEGIIKNSVHYAKNLKKLVEKSKDKQNLTEVLQILESIALVDEKLDSTNKDGDYDPENKSLEEEKEDGQFESEPDTSEQSKNQKNRKSKKNSKISGDSDSEHEKYAIVQDSVHIDQSVKTEEPAEIGNETTELTIRVNGNHLAAENNILNVSDREGTSLNTTVEAPPVNLENGHLLLFSSDSDDDILRNRLEKERNTTSIKDSKKFRHKRKKDETSGNETKEDSSDAEESDVKVRQETNKKSKNVQNRKDNFSSEDNSDLDAPNSKLKKVGEVSEKNRKEEDSNIVARDKSSDISESKTSENDSESFSIENVPLSKRSEKDGKSRKEGEQKKDSNREVEENDKDETIADSQATVLDSQDFAVIRDDVDKAKTGQISRRNSAESFVFDMSDYLAPDTGTKETKGSEHISEFNSPCPSLGGSENIEGHHSDHEPLTNDKPSDNTDKENSKPNKEPKEKVIRKTLLKVIDEYFKKKKTQRKKTSRKSKVETNPEVLQEKPVESDNEVIDKSKISEDSELSSNDAEKSDLNDLDDTNPNKILKPKENFDDVEPTKTSDKISETQDDSETQSDLESKQSSKPKDMIKIAVEKSKTSDTDTEHKSSEKSPKPKADAVEKENIFDENSEQNSKLQASRDESVEKSKTSDDTQSDTDALSVETEHSYQKMTPKNQSKESNLHETDSEVDATMLLGFEDDMISSVVEIEDTSNTETEKENQQSELDSLDSLSSKKTVLAPKVDANNSFENEVSESTDNEIIIRKNTEKHTPTLNREQHNLNDSDSDSSNKTILVLSGVDSSDDVNNIESYKAVETSVVLDNAELEDKKVDIDENELICSDAEILTIASETVVLSATESEENDIDKIVEDLTALTSDKQTDLDTSIENNNDNDGSSEEENIALSENDADSESSAVVPAKKRVMRIPSTEPNTQSSENIIRSINKENESEIEGDIKATEDDNGDVLQKDLAITQSTVEQHTFSTNSSETIEYNLEDLQYGPVLTEEAIEEVAVDELAGNNSKENDIILEESNKNDNILEDSVVNKKRKLDQLFPSASNSDTEELPLKNAKLDESTHINDHVNSECVIDEKETDSKDVEMTTNNEKLKEDDDSTVEDIETEMEIDEDNFQLDDKERDELLDLLNEHFKHINDGVEGENDSKETEEIISQAASEGCEINRELLLKLLQEYEDAIATGKELDLEDDKVKSEPGSDENQQTESTENQDVAGDVPKDNGENMQDDGQREEGCQTPEPLLQLVKEEEFIQQTPGKKGRRKTELREAIEVYKKLMEEESDFDTSSSNSATSSPLKNTDSDVSDVERDRKKPTFKVTRQLLDEFGIDKELVVKIKKEDIGDSDLKMLPKSVKEAVKIDRLCDLTSILQQRKRNSSTSEPETPKKKRGRKRRPSSRSSPTSSLFSSHSSDDDDSDPGSRAGSRGGHSPVNFHSDDSQEAMARAFMDRMRGDSSDEENSLHLGITEDSGSASDSKTTKKKVSLMDSSGSEADKEEDNKKKASKEDGKEEEGKGGKSGDEGRKKAPKQLTAEEKRKKRWKRDPLLHGRMLSSGPSSDSSDDSDAGSDASLRRRQRIDRLKSKYDVKSTDSDSKKPDSDNKPDSDSDTSDVMKAIFKDKDKIKREKRLENSDSDSSSVEFVSTKMKTPPKRKPKKLSSDTESDDEVAEGESPSKGKGRRNIRELLSDEALAVDTKKANEEEKKRMKRLEEKKSQRETFSQTQSSFGSQDGEEDALVLDIDKNTLEPLIKVHPKITRRLKPHQRDGIQFMWDSCYESCDQMKKGWRGSGCILAHCMGLGKTLQVLGLVHTIFNYSEITKTKHVLVICPLSTVSNWRNEYKLAYKNIEGCDVSILTIEDKKTNERKFDIVKRWKRKGGILVMGYEAFNNLTNDSKLEKWQKQRQCNKEDVLEALVDPGPDLVVCDEGHLLKNKQTQRNISLNKVKTRRRIVLTGTPLQNNLIEYYCMVNFVKPNLLGNEKEYKTNFVNPITNGQYEDSTVGDIKLMKYRTHVLHRMLKGTVQRVEDTELKKYLPKLVDYALFIQISETQVDFYNTYLDLAAEGLEFNKEGNLCQKNFLADVVMAKYICSHPYLLSVVDKKEKKKIKEQDVIEDAADFVVASTVSTNKWWRNMLPKDASERLELGHKVMLALAIVEETEALDEKILIFSQNLGEMDVLEHFLSTRGTRGCPRWQKRVDYFRMDGTIIPEERAIMCDKFNNPKNKKLRVFIISTKVGGLGLNLTAATRIVLMSVNWNPSYDTQSVFRAYRFGQEKPVFVYRLISMHTMEEKIYQRSVTKLAVAHRVVDKHQIRGQYSKADIEEMYGIRPTKNLNRPVPNYPEDDELLAKLLQKHKFIHRWHEHQGLLANRPEEDLDDQEKELAWEEFNKKQEAPPPQTAFNPGMQPNMGALAAMNLLNIPGGSNITPANLMNMINSYNTPKYSDEHSYSLPTNTNAAGPSTSGVTPQPTNHYQPRTLFNQSTNCVTNNLPANHQPNNTVHNYPNGVIKTNPNNVMRMQNMNANNTRTQLPTMVGANRPTVPNTTGIREGNNWLTRQVAGIGPDQALKFSLKCNVTNEHGLRSLAWPGIKVHTKNGVIHFSYKPPHIPSVNNIQWTRHSVVGPDGSLISVHTPSQTSTSTADNTVPSSVASSAAASTAQPGSGHVIRETETGACVIPSRMAQPALAASQQSPLPKSVFSRKVAPSPLVAAKNTTPVIRRLPTSTVTAPVSAPTTETKLVVPNPFSQNHIIRSGSAPVIKRVVPDVQAKMNNVKAAGLTGTKHVVPNPVISQVKLNGAVSPRPSVAPPPAHTGRIISSPTVAKSPASRTNAHHKSLENLSPSGNVIDLSAATANRTPANRSHTLLKSPPNQNIHNNPKTATSIKANSTVNSIKNGANFPSVANSPRSSRNLADSPKAGGSTPKFVTSRELSAGGRSPGGGVKRVYGAVKDGGGKSPVARKKIIISQDTSRGNPIPTALPALTPRPTVAPINVSTKDIYKEMLKNLQGGGTSFTSKGTSAPTRATPPSTPSTSQSNNHVPLPASNNKENRRNRTQSNAIINLEHDAQMAGSSTVNQQTLNKLKEKGVTLNKVESGVINLD